MKRLSGIISLVCLVLGLTSCAGGKLDTQQMVKHEANASVALVYYDEVNDDDTVSDIKPYCSGVWVDSTHIMTAYHCVKIAQQEQQRKQVEREANKPACEGLAALLGMCDPDEKPAEPKKIALKGCPVHYLIQVEASGISKEPQGWHLARVTGWDAAHDLAVMSVDAPSAPAHEVAELADKVPAQGEPVYVVGHPNGFYWTFLQGTVAGYRGSMPGTDKAGPFLQLQVPVFHGNSGGGAFDAYGKLIGIADMLPGLPSEGIFIPVDPLRTFLQFQGILEGSPIDKPTDSKPVP